MTFLLAACQASPTATGDEHALFATEAFGGPGNGDHPTAATVWLLEMQAERLCPRGYERLDEQMKLFADGRQWIWQVRCAAPPPPPPQQQR